MWSLEERDIIRMKMNSRRRLWLGRRRIIEIERIDVTPRAGLEAVMTSVPTQELDVYVDEDTTHRPGPLGNVHDVIRAWAGGMTEDPQWKLIGLAVEEARSFGLVERRKDGDLWCCDRVAKLEVAFEGLAKRWKQFAERNRPLYELLVHDCREGIKSVDGWEVTTDGKEALGAILSAELRRKDYPWPRSSPANR
jgi:hypothetical protein